MGHRGSGVKEIAPKSGYAHIRLQGNRLLLVWQDRTRIQIRLCWPHFRVARKSGVPSRIVESRANREWKVLGKKRKKKQEKLCVSYKAPATRKTTMPKGDGKQFNTFKRMCQQGKLPWALGLWAMNNELRGWWSCGGSCECGCEGPKSEDQALLTPWQGLTWPAKVLELNWFDYAAGTIMKCQMLYLSAAETFGQEAQARTLGRTLTLAIK